MSTHVFRYGDPVVPGVHELSKATLMADEKPYVYHLLPASQHIGGAVLKAAAGPDSTAEYTIDLGGEPAPVYSYLHLHPDTALAIQSLNVTVHHSPGVLVEARIRQYNAAGVEDFSVPLDWQPLPEGQPYALDFATDVTAIVAGGATMLEYRTSPVGGGTFAAASEVTYTATATTVSISELRDVLVTICDEKDNYRFGFNGQEKVNEVNGIGNHNTALFWEYDTRLGRRWNLDPKPLPSISQYSVFVGNPILHSDFLGDFIQLKGTTEFQTRTLNSLQKLTNDKLIIDKAGYVRIESKGTANEGKKYTEGTKLVTELVGNRFENKIGNSPDGMNRTLIDPKKANLKADKTANEGSSGYVQYNPDRTEGGKDVEGNRKRPAEIGLGHELGHLRDANRGTVDTDKSDVTDPDDSNKKLENDELKIRKEENNIRNEQGLPDRIRNK